MDGFHYASEELQFDIAYQLKDAIRKEFKAVVISLPHRVDDAIRKNADLSGRFSCRKNISGKSYITTTYAVYIFKFIMLSNNEIIVKEN